MLREAEPRRPDCKPRLGIGFGVDLRPPYQDANRGISFGNLGAPLASILLGFSKQPNAASVTVIVKLLPKTPLI